MLTALAITGLFAPAYAADVPVPAVPVPLAALPNWTGFYLGGHIGIIDANAHYDYSTLFTGELNNHTRIGTINGAAPGATAGFNYQYGSLVVGVEGDATFTNGKFSLNGPNFDFLQFANGVYTVAGRLGYLLTPATMAYGKAGFSRIQLGGYDGFGDVFHKTVNGTQVGAGIEHLITDNISLRVEGVYTSGTNDLILNQGFDHYRPSFIWATAGLSYKFDPGIPRPAGEPRFAFTNRLITHDPNWTSIWAGGDLGAGAGQTTRYDLTLGPPYLLGPYNDTRFVGGVMAGGDWQFARYFVAGAGIDVQFMHATFDDDVGVGLATVYHRFATIDRIAAVTGRLGVLVSPTVLLYGKGGPAQIRFVPNQDYFAAINPAAVVSGHNLPAVQGGLGMETQVADNLALRVEGLYTRATRAVVIDGVVPGQTTLQPSTLTGTVGLVVKY